MNAQVAALTAAEVVSAGWVCVNPDSFAGYLFWSAPTDPGTLFYLLVANAVMGLVWNIAKIVNFVAELRDWWQKLLALFGHPKPEHDDWEWDDDMQDASEHVDPIPPPMPPPPVSPPPALPLNFLRDSYVMRPVQNYHKIHLFSGCAHIQNHHVESRRICRDCVQEVLKKTR